jgi:hypothetical protein
LAYQPPASSTVISEQTSHRQPASSTLLSEQTGISYQPPANRTGYSFKKSESKQEENVIFKYLFSESDFGHAYNNGRLYVSIDTEVIYISFF